MIKPLRQYSLSVVLFAAVAVPALAQLPPVVPAELYGRGVHAYFSGQYAAAEDYLSRALASNPDDPRIFYFRGLSLLRMGRADEACGEFQIGASLEAERPNRFAVGTALQRIQGGDRLTLERYRREAQTAAATQRRSQRAHIQQQYTIDTDALRRPVVVPLDEFASPGDPRALSAEELDQRAAAAAARAAMPLPPQARPTAPAAPADPFGDDAAAAPVQPADDTAAPSAEADVSDDAAVESDEPADPAEFDAPTETPPPAETDDDPFGDLQ